MDISKHLSAAKKELSKIESLTKSLGENPSFEDIAAVFKKRDVLVANMKHSESQLTQKDSHWVNQVDKDVKGKPLFEESWALLRSVNELDKKIAFLIEGRMAEIKGQLSKIYNNSRATYSYVTQSSFKSMRQNSPV